MEGNVFWQLVTDLIEREYSFKIPKYLVNLLNLQGYDNIFSVNQLDDDAINQLEVYARNERFRKQIPKEADLRDYFGIFYNDPAEFEILPGHKKLLRKTVHFIQKTFNGDSEHINNQLLQENHSNSQVKATAYLSLDLPENATLKMLVDATEQNSKRHKNGYRHSEQMKMFSSYIKMIGGKLLYEFIHANMAMTFPSPSTVDRFIQHKKNKVIEGMLRVEELKTYLVQHNCPLAVVISEDATRNVGRVCYNPSTNQLVGFVLPLSSNGMPVPHSFPARSAKEIEDHFKNENNVVSTMSVSIMAQPLDETVAPFFLTIFSTDNKFTADHITNRWRHIKEKLQEHNINVYVYASDGDSRLVKAMKTVTQIGVSSQSVFDCKWFSFGNLLTESVDGIQDVVYFQDTTHVLTKGRNRILKTASIFPMGNKIVSSGHLKFLVDQISKDKHLLTKTDIEPKDRQNSRSAEKLCHARTRQCLKDYVPGSEGTVIYLKMLNYATSSMLDPKMELEERIRKMWYSVFLCRIWRSSLVEIINTQKRKMQLRKLQMKLKSFVKYPAKKSLTEKRRKLSNKSKNRKVRTGRNKNRYNFRRNKVKVSAKVKDINSSNKYTLSECFISSNCYTCIEINAHSLIKFVIKLRRSNKPSLFAPTLLGSQANESSFRQLRAMTTTQSTVINFPLIDMLHRVDRIELQNDIMAKCTWLKFPRNDQKSVLTPKITELPTDSDIIALIEEAKKEAINDATNIGMYSDNINLACQIDPVSACKLSDNTSEIDDDDRDEEDNLHSFGNDSEEINDYFDNELSNDEEIERQKDVCILTSLAGSVSMRDYSQANMTLSEESPYTIVIDNTGKEYVVRKSSIVWLLTNTKHSLSSDRLQRVRDEEFNKQQKGCTTQRTRLTKDNCLQINQEVFVGDWCLFYFEKRFVIGLILSFSYITGTTYRTREYSRNFASVSSEKKIGTLCNWYSWTDSGHLYEESKHKYFVNLENYRATILSPTFANNVLFMENTLINKIKSL